LADSVNVRRSNTILYCIEWADTVAFYRDVIALEPTHEVDWFVEFALHDAARLSVADFASVGAPSSPAAEMTQTGQYGRGAEHHVPFGPRPTSSQEQK